MPANAENPTERALAGALSAILDDSSPVAALVLDTDYVVQDANSSAARALGLAASALVGTALGETVVDDDLERLRAAVRAGEADPLLLRPRAAPSGSGLLVSVLGRPGGAGGLVLVGRDAGREVEREARVRRAARYEIVGQIASGIAHEINNMLTTVTTFSDLLLAKAEPGSTDAEDLADVKQAGLEAAKITRKLDLFANGRAGELDTTDLPEVVRGLQKLLRRFFPEDVKIDVELQDEVPPVGCPPIRMEEAILALAANARDAMPEGGVCRIEVRRAARDDAGTEWVILEVSDTGSTTATPAVELVLEPFFSTKAPARGTGLGLSSVSSIVEDLRGTLEMAPWEGGGTTVRLSLPAADASLESGEAAASRGSTATGRGGDVLVVEPRDRLREGMMRALVAHGLTATAVERLDRVTGDASRGAPRLVVTDVPDLPGAADRTVGAAREVWPGVPMVLVRSRPYSDHSRPSDGVLELLVKPFTVDLLHSAIDRALSGSDRASAPEAGV